MKGKRYPEEQIIKVLKELETGVSVAEVCRKYNISDNAIYAWKNKYSGLTVSELHKLKQLQDENSRLKKIVAEQALDIQALKYVNSKNW